MTHRIVDRIGIAASTLCAVHCAAIPVIAALAGGGLGFLSSTHAWHTAFVFGTVVFALVSVVAGVVRHGQYRALFFVAAAIVLGVLSEAGHDYLETQPFWHGAIFAAMGVLLATGHWLNIKLLHGHLHDATCNHHE